MNFNGLVEHYNITIQHWIDDGHIEPGSSQQVSLLLTPCKSLNLLEHYDGMCLTLDGDRFLLCGDDDDHTIEVIDSVHSFFADRLWTLTNLESFSFISCHNPEISFERFKNAPPTLKHFHFGTSRQINPEFIQHAVSLKFESLIVNNIVTIPDTLLIIRQTNFEFDTHDQLFEFIQKLKQLPHFQALIVENAVKDYDRETEIIQLFHKYLPRCLAYNSDY